MYKILSENSIGRNNSAAETIIQQPQQEAYNISKILNTIYIYTYTKGIKRSR